MARKPRDYKAEYAKRKARMASAGRKRDYKAEYAKRKARATSEGYKSPKHKTRSNKALKQTGFPNAAHAREYLKGQARNPHNRTSSFLPEDRYEALKEQGYSDAEIASLHYRLFGPKSPTSIKKLGGDKWIRQAETKRWFVDVLGYYTSKEYDEKYGVVH